MALNQPQAVKAPVPRRQSSGLMWRLLIFSGVIFGVMIISWVGLEFGYRAILENQIEKVDQEANSLIAGVSVEEQELVVDFYSRLANIKSLLRDHIYMSNFLGMIEETTDQGVALSKISIVIEDGNIDARGTARAYTNLAKQLENWKNIEGVNSLNLKSANKGTDGRISWLVTFNTNRNLLLKDK